MRVTMELEIPIEDTVAFLKLMKCDFGNSIDEAIKYLEGCEEKTFKLAWIERET